MSTGFSRHWSINGVVVTVGEVDIASYASMKNINKLFWESRG